jgi:tetratricopeptide (TPR) repeat protein
LTKTGKHSIIQLEEKKYMENDGIIGLILAFVFIGIIVFIFKKRSTSYNLSRKFDPTNGVKNIMPSTIEGGMGIADITNKMMAKTFFDAGLIFAKSQDYKLAINQFSEAIKRDKNYGEAYRIRALSYLELKEYDSAIPDFDEALRIDSENSSAYSGLGRAYIGKGQFIEAIEVLKEAIKIDPNNSGAYIGLGNACLKINKQDEALAAFIEANKLEPNNQTVLQLINILNNKKH